MQFPSSPPLLLLVACNGAVQLDDSNPPVVDCTGADPFLAGMEAPTDLGHAVRLMQANPAPPDVGDNTWTIWVADAEGLPMAGLTPTVRPFMPLHGHGLTPATYVGTETSAGTYTMETFDLIMPGLWEFTVDLSGDSTDTALFALCAEG